MSKDCFSFKRFTVWQDRCAMKVGTDGVLLGAWAPGGRRVLDIGTGTGLVALMMAQRFPEAAVCGIELDGEAVMQARDNVARSPFGNIAVEQADVNSYWPDHEAEYDCIVSNPPYFVGSLAATDHRRTLARHTATLTHQQLLHAAWQMLTDDGFLSVVIPAEGKADFYVKATLQGFSLACECNVKTTPSKPPKRALLTFRKHPPTAIEHSEGVIETTPGERSEWYSSLTKDFYL